jgi:large subunit ribosomal protein L27
MSTTKSSGSTSLGRDSVSKRLGVKKFAGETAISGNIIVRQRGGKFLSGKGTRRGKDFTIYSITEGVVKFTEKNLKGFNGKRRTAKVVNILPASK